MTTLQTILCYLTLKLKTKVVTARRQNKTIASLSVPDIHRMCCAMIIREILVTTLAVHLVFKYQQQILFLANGFTVRLVPRLGNCKAVYGSPSLHWGPSGYGPFHPHAVAGYPHICFSECRFQLAEEAVYHSTFPDFQTSDVFRF